MTANFKLTGSAEGLLVTGWLTDDTFTATLTLSPHFSRAHAKLAVRGWLEQQFGALWYRLHGTEWHARIMDEFEKWRVR